MSSGGSGSQQPLAAQAKDACATMHAALAALKESHDLSVPTPTRQQLAGAVQRLKMEAAKLGLLFNQDAAPTQAEASALLAGMQAAVSGLCVAYLGVLTSAGPSLRTAVHAAATAAVEAAVALVGGALVNGARGEQLMMLAGFAMEMCDAAAKAPLSNKAAIGRAATQVSVVGWSGVVRGSCRQAAC